MIWRTRNLKGCIKTDLGVVSGLIIPVIVFAVRERVGIDWENYYDYYNYYNVSGGLNGYMEIGFNFLVFICKILNLNFYAFSFVCSAVMMYCVVKSVEMIGRRDELWLGYFTFLFSIYFFSFNGLRTALAACVLLLTYSFALENKYFKGIVACLIACLLHKTALLGLFVLVIKLWLKLLSKCKKRYSGLLIVFAGVIAVTLFSFFNADYLLSIIHSFELYTTYGRVEFRWKEFLFLLYFIPELAFISYFIRKIEVREELMLYIIFTSTILFQVMGSIIPFIDRLSVYTMSGRILLYPRIYNKLRPHGRHNFAIISIVWFLFYFVIVYIGLNANAIFPYRTFL